MTTQQRGEETRTHILDAAGELFARRGYDATSVDDICTRAKVTKGAFYHHFATKHQVFIELRDRWLAELDTQLASADTGGATVPQQLRRMAEMAGPVFQLVGKNWHLQMFVEFVSAARHDPTIPPAMIAPYRKYCDMFAALIKAGIEEGTLRRVDPEIAAQLIVSFGLGLMIQALLDPKGADWGMVTQKTVRLLLQGLENVT
jgi:AcrR family transcriptional regulator